MKKFATALLTSASIMVAASSAHATIIDDYESGTFFQAAGFDMVTNATSSVAGVDRLITATTSGADTVVAINTVDTLGLYAHSQSSGIFGSSSIMYELGGIDLTDMMTKNAFRIEVARIDVDGIIGISIGTDSESLLVDFGNGADVIANGIDIPFSAFAADLSLGATVTLFIDGTDTADLDVSISQFGTVCSANTSVGSGTNSSSCGVVTVSEPASLGLLGLGLVGIGAAARRRKA